MLISDDPLFENPKPSQWAAEAMTTFAREQAKYVIEAKWERARIGPQYQPDEARFTVSIPADCAQGEELEALIKSIRTTIRNHRAGRFLKRETFADRTELHFEPDGPGSYIVTLMWESDEVPAPVTVWHYNEGRRYQVIAWDYATSAPTVHPSLLPPELRPKFPKSDSPPRLRKSASLEEAIDWLCARLGDITTDHPELTDTAIRDRLFDTLVDNFLKPKKRIRIPKSFGMDEEYADHKLHRVFSTFVKIAGSLAEAQGLSPQQRLDLVNQRPFDEFFGHCDSI
jgi:hypothetical protein